MVTAWWPGALLGTHLQMLRVTLADLRIGGIATVVVGVVGQPVSGPGE